MTRSSYRPFALACAIGLAAFGNIGAQPSTVILVRHAEKAAAPREDPVLTEAGAQRSIDLASALASARVTAVFATQFQRTQLTAKPSADANGLTPIIIRAGVPGVTHADAVAAAVKSLPAGDVVLVVGHSNTIPAIVAALGGPKLPDLCDAQYATLFILEFPPSGAPRLIRATYGATDPPDADACARPAR